MKIIDNSPTFADVEIGGLFDLSTGSFESSAVKGLKKVSPKTYLERNGKAHRLNPAAHVYNIRPAQT